MIRKISTVLAVILVTLCISSPSFAEKAANGPIRNFLDGLFAQEKQQEKQQDTENVKTPESNKSEPSRRIPFNQGEIQLSFAPLVDKTARSVVNVYAARIVQVRRSPFEGDPFFEQFFGRQFGQAQPRVQSSLGSGVIVDGEGLVVTNNHVIDGMDQIKVALSDGREFESRVVLRDERSDLAVLQIDTREELPSLEFGLTDQLQTGDLVLAIGNPFGVGQTITSGIISAGARTRAGVSDFGFFIQTDAAINPGNSGGALINMTGQLVGINTAIFSRSGGSNGIGFAIPADMVRAVVAQAKGGSDAFERPYMGADFDVVTPEMAESLGMHRPAGAIVTGVAKGGPSEQAGLRVGDVVIGINKQKIQHPDALGYRIATLEAGNTVNLEVLSRGKLDTLELTLIKQPEETKKQSIILEGQTPFSGAHISEISNRLARKYRIQSGTEGIIIKDIKRGSNAQRAGFRPGDIIHSVNGIRMNNVSDMVRVVEEGGRSWRFRLNRGGSIIQQILRF